MRRKREEELIFIGMVSDCDGDSDSVSDGDGCLLPRHQPVIIPKIPILASAKRPKKTSDLYFRDFFSTICTSRQSENEHISIIKAYSWHKRDHIAHRNRVWSRGYQVPDEECAVQQPSLHKVNDKLSRGAQFTNLLENGKSWP